MSPGLAIDKHILSSKDLENYTEPHSWSPAQAMQSLKEEGWEGCLIHPEGWSESLNNLLCWGSQEVQDVLIQGQIFAYLSVHGANIYSLYSLKNEIQVYENGF